MSESLSNDDISRNKLLSDYKSLREKHNFLKTALINERNKNKTLEDTITELHIQSRKPLQEIESFKYRNELLTKQLNAMREELDNERVKKSKKSNKKDGESSSEVEVIKEDLMNKINECSQLHSRIDELTLDHKMESENFKSAISDLEKQLKLVQEQKEEAQNIVQNFSLKEAEEKQKVAQKIEHKELIILKLKQNEQVLIQENSNLKTQLQKYQISPAASQTNVWKDVKSTEDVKSVCDSESNSKMNENGNEAYLDSLIDKISVLEKSLSSLELNYEIIMKRQASDKMQKECYENFINSQGLELPEVVVVQQSTSSTNEDNVSDTQDFAVLLKFYEEKIENLTKCTYKALAKASLYYDELKISGNRIDMECVEKTLLQTENSDLKKKLQALQEDLELTRNQYEDKMKEMSIHMANLNTQYSNKL